VHADHELPLQVWTPSPQVSVQGRVAPSVLQGEMRIAVRPSQALRTAKTERKAKRESDMVDGIGARLLWPCARDNWLSRQRHGVAAAMPRTHKPQRSLRTKAGPSPPRWRPKLPCNLVRCRSESHRQHRPKPRQPDNDRIGAWPPSCRASVSSKARLRECELRLRLRSTHVNGYFLSDI
jgi:hypothetical protein